MDEDFLKDRLDLRKKEGVYRSLTTNKGIDFCSNDYLGIVTNGLIRPDRISQSAASRFGSTGSRLISGNSQLCEDTEKLIAEFHQSEAALLFNSGYDANLGLMSCIATRTDTIVYDKLSHASIRDGVSLSPARSFSFDHNSPNDLKIKLKQASGRVFVVTESLFSMDGDLAPLNELAAICKHHGAFLIVDEAHATGIIGARGEGWVQHCQLEKSCFARVITFGKALGCHGAAVLGSGSLRDYLVNFSRSFIFTTAMPAVNVSAIAEAYAVFPQLAEERQKLNSLVRQFQAQTRSISRTTINTPIQAVMIPGNEKVRKIATAMQVTGLDTRPILSPTVPPGTERIRIVIHSFNTAEQITMLSEELSKLLRLSVNP